MELSDPTLLTWAFVVGGVLLMALETVIPGGVAGFLGLGGLVVAGVRAMGWLVDPWTAFITWAFLSVGFTIALRPLAMRFVQGDVSLSLTNEDAEAMGEVVTVLETVGEEEAGRIRHRGSSWSARSVEGTLPEGAKVRLLYRDNLTWIVEPADDADLDQELSDATDGRLPDADSSAASGLDYDPSAPGNE